VVVRLGERYLWVDRLCIIQDDERDKLEQMSHMDRVYSLAILTIVNATAYCADDDIPGVKSNTRRTLQHSEVVAGIRYITT
jgi:Heterokaryon incompatibility protein (HET)